MRKESLSADKYQWTNEKFNFSFYPFRNQNGNLALQSGTPVHCAHNKTMMTIQYFINGQQYCEHIIKNGT